MTAQYFLATETVAKTSPSRLCLRGRLDSFPRTAGLAAWLGTAAASAGEHQARGRKQKLHETFQIGSNSTLVSNIRSRSWTLTQDQNCAGAHPLRSGPAPPKVHTHPAALTVTQIGALAVQGWEKCKAVAEQLSSQWLVQARQPFQASCMATRSRTGVRIGSLSQISRETTTVYTAAAQCLRGRLDSFLGGEQCEEAAELPVWQPRLQTAAATAGPHTRSELCWMG